MTSVPTWLDQDAPHDEERSAAQCAGLRQLFGRPGVNVLDLGCGGGRTVLPIVEGGARVTGVDHDAAAIARCQAACEEIRGGVDLRTLDITDEWPALGGPFDVVMCLGNTWMTLWDLDIATSVLRRVRKVLKPSGVFVLDDLAHDFWGELTEGNWQAGLSEDGDMQMVWAAAEPVFAIREGDDVDAASWTLRATDRRFRLWTMDTLTLLARACGFSDPQRRSQEGLLVLSPV
ncbi:MAG: class I SAM-dependent methyltransferase [Phycisphaerales bacterium]|nr:class I SAM-dependent methyltransferase [Phycisphaerales bacterium]